jgi:hypothetical protein
MGRTSPLHQRNVRYVMKTARGLFWTPRVLGILFTLLVSIFALDVFGEGRGFGETMLALAMHLIPAMLVLSALVIAWRWEAAGGILFITLGTFYLVTTLHHLDWCLLISGPLFVTGGLFLTDWAYRARLRCTADVQ